MVVTPNSRIRLLKSPIELDERNQLTFSSLTAQTNYFLSLPYLEYDNCSYQRKDGVIRYQTYPTSLTYEDLLAYNYCMYQNTNYDNKWFYAFVTDIKYVNDGMTEIKIETDVMQTWKFEINYKPSFIEREHVNNDSRGANLLPEGLETGEYISQYVSDFSIGNSHVVMASSVNPSDLSNAGGGTYGGIYSGVDYFIFDNFTFLYNALSRIATASKLDMINSLFYCPDFITGYASATFDSNGIAKVGSTSNPTSILVPLTPSTIDGYTPKNNKLFNSPYIQYVLSNNSGGSMTYNLEDFKDSGNHLGEIKVRGCCTPGASIRAIPVNYKCTGDNNEYGLTMGKFPVCSWPADVYTNWLTQQSVNQTLRVASAVLSPLGSGASSLNSGYDKGISNLEASNSAGSVINWGVNVFSTIAENEGEKYVHSLTPVEARGNVNSGDVTFTIGKLTYTGYMMTIKSQYARVIDEFFSMFGYKVNRVKTPNLDGRTNWNYVKTVGLNITGDIPQADMQKIKDIFDNGVTLWHNPSTFLDYSQSNTIIS